MRQRHTCFVDLVHLVGRVGTVQRFVEGEDHLLQLWLGTIILGIWYENDLLAMNIRLYREWSITAAQIQVVSPGLAILGNQALLNDEAALEGQCIQEEGNRLVGRNDHSVGIRGLDAVPDDGFDAASCEFVRVFNILQIVGSSSGLEL